MVALGSSPKAFSHLVRGRFLFEHLPVSGSVFPQNQQHGGFRATGLISGLWSGARQKLDLLWELALEVLASLPLYSWSPEVPEDQIPASWKRSIDSTSYWEEGQSHCKSLWDWIYMYIGPMERWTVDLKTLGYAVQPASPWEVSTASQDSSLIFKRSNRFHLWVLT